MKPIKRKFYEPNKNKDLFIEVIEYQSSDTNLKISDCNFDSDNIMLVITHNEMNTLLDFKGASDYRVLFVDENNCIAGGTYAKNNSQGFMIQTQSKKIILSTLKPVKGF